MKLRILFVDDEPRLLKGIERTFFGIDDVEILTATSGPAALALLESETVDVVVSDMRMPGMDGAQLLAEVQIRHPRVVRIIFSGHTGIEGALRAVDVAHQFLSKPCPPDEILDAVRRATMLERLRGNARLASLVGKVDRLPSPPTLYLELTKMLAEEAVDVHTVAALVRRDAALTAKCLQLANSSFFFRGDSTHDVKQAVVRLGTRIVRNLALHSGVFASVDAAQLGGFDVELASERAFRASLLVLDLVPAALYVEGSLVALVADIGHLVIAMQRPGVLDVVAKIVSAENRDRCIVEREQLGFDHTEVSAYLLALWGLPTAVVDQVLDHHRVAVPTSPTWDTAHAVCLAHAVVDDDVLPLGWLDSPIVKAALERIGARATEPVAVPTGATS